MSPRNTRHTPEFNPFTGASMSNLTQSMPKPPRSLTQQLRSKDLDGPVRLRVVSGAPCSGKTTYCQQHASPEAVIVDLDTIANALGAPQGHWARGPQLDAALEARHAVIDWALAHPTKETFVIDTNPTTQALSRYEAAGAEVVVLDPGIDICLERSLSRPKRTADVIRAWYSNPPRISP